MPCKFEFPLPRSLASTFLDQTRSLIGTGSERLAGSDSLTINEFIPGTPFVKLHNLTMNASSAWGRVARLIQPQPCNQPRQSCPQSTFETLGVVALEPGRRLDEEPPNFLSMAWTVLFGRDCLFLRQTCPTAERSIRRGA